MSQYVLLRGVCSSVSKGLLDGFARQPNDWQWRSCVLDSWWVVDWPGVHRTSSGTSLPAVLLKEDPVVLEANGCYWSVAVFLRVCMCALPADGSCTVVAAPAACSAVGLHCLEERTHTLLVLCASVRGCCFSGQGFDLMVSKVMRRWCVTQCVLHGQDSWRDIARALVCACCAGTARRGLEAAVVTSAPGRFALKHVHAWESAVKRYRKLLCMGCLRRIYTFVHSRKLLYTGVNAVVEGLHGWQLTCRCSCGLESGHRCTALWGGSSISGLVSNSWVQPHNRSVAAYQLGRATCSGGCWLLAQFCSITHHV